MEVRKANSPPLSSGIIVCIYGDPGNRKTSFAITAEAPIILDFDRRAHRAYGAENVDRADVTSFDDIAEAAVKFKGKYKSLIIDTAGRALDVKTEEIIKVSKANPTLKAHSPFGGLSLPGYGILKSAFYQTIQVIKSSGMHCVFVCHGKRTKEGEVTSYEPDVVGSSSDEIYKSCDLMGLIMPVNGRTVGMFNPSERYQAKNPLGLKTVILDKQDEPGWDVTLKELIDRCVIQSVKVATPTEMHPIIKKVQDCKDMETATGLLAEIETMPDGVDRDMAAAEFKKMRTAMGFKYSKEKGLYK